MPLPGLKMPALNGILANVGTASNAQILQIVALVDAMPERGAADALIAPLRPRLARLCPPRPLKFTRLMFTPLDTLIVAAPAWRRGSLSVPRTALGPIIAPLRSLMTAEATLVDAAGRAGPVEPTRVTEHAKTIWPRAAIALESMPAPLDWLDATGLPRTDYPAIAATMAAVLSVAAEIHWLVQQGRPPAEDAIRIILGRTAPRGDAALSAVVVVLLALLPAPGFIVALGIEAAGRNPPKAIDAAIEHTLDRLQTALDEDRAIGFTVARGAQDTCQIADLLLDLEIGATHRPERKRRIDRLRSIADTMCRTRFEAALQAELIDRLDRLPGNPGDEIIESLEASARSLRQWEMHGRLLGSPECYETMLESCKEPIEQMTGKLRREDRVRLTEILIGPREAIALLR
jgi:hypothetical protein